MPKRRVAICKLHKYVEFANVCSFCQLLRSTTMRAKQYESKNKHTCKLCNIVVSDEHRWWIVDTCSHHVLALSSFAAWLSGLSFTFERLERRRCCTIETTTIKQHNARCAKEPRQQLKDVYFCKTVKDCKDAHQKNDSQPS